ncbi:hypothetical protein ART_1593 [Arthrobacter sp. PAMC 25486]|uniref:hypothetical protein n=1 Tax=Arthrobacter sp. PAMC 25486 TaxID=1494608 RepID=UPI000535F259|nr:hypothetical protein [Arthrobacter sp. PAMC 25486]AIY01192.1 hypothetical protein ART_1593 [Arthrobacter sp. PAMC 25486]
MTHTPTPEAIGAIQAAARVNAYLADFAAKYGCAAGFVDSVNVNQSNGLYADDLARLTAFVTAIPLIAAQALRDAADAFDYAAWDFTADGMDKEVGNNIDCVGVPIEWLRARAATIEWKSE